MLTKLDTSGEFATNIASLLRWADATYLEVYITEGLVYFVIETSAQSAVYASPVLEQREYKEDIFIRIDRKKLQKLLLPGALEILTGSEIKIVFYDEFDTRQYSITIPSQVVDTRSIKEAVQLAVETQGMEPVKALPPSALSQIGRNLKQPVSAIGGIGYVKTPGLICFQKLGCSDVTLEAEVFHKLSREAGKLYNVGNRLVLNADSGIYYIARKLRVFAAEDLDNIIKSPTFYSIECNMGPIASMVKKVDLKEGELFIDFETGKVKVTEANYDYELFIQINHITSVGSKKKEETLKDMDIADLIAMNKNSSLASRTYDIPVLKLSKDVLSKVVPSFPNLAKVQVLIKHTFIVMRSNNLFVVCKKEVADEYKRGL